MKPQMQFFEALTDLSVSLIGHTSHYEISKVLVSHSLQESSNMALFLSNCCVKPLMKV